MSMGNVELCSMYNTRSPAQKEFQEIKGLLEILPDLYILRVGPYCLYIFVITYALYCFFSTEYSPINKCPSFFWIPIPIRLSCLVSQYCSKKEYLWLEDKS